MPCDTACQERSSIGEFNGSTDVLVNWSCQRRHLKSLPPSSSSEVHVGEMAVLIEVGLSHEPGVYPEIRDAPPATGVNGRFKVLDELRHVGAVGSFHISSVGT